MPTKIMLNAFNQNGEPVTLLLDKNVSFVFKFKEVENNNKSYFSVSGIDGVFNISGDFIEMIDDIEAQISDIISNEKSIK